MDFHFVPGRVDHSVPKQLKLQVRLFSFLPDIRADIIPLKYKLLVLMQIYDELISLELLDIGDLVVVKDEVFELPLNYPELVHNLAFEGLLLLSIRSLELFLHDVCEELHVGRINWVHF